MLAEKEQHAEELAKLLRQMQAEQTSKEADADAMQTRVADLVTTHEDKLIQARQQHGCG